MKKLVDVINRLKTTLLVMDMRHADCIALTRTDIVEMLVLLKAQEPRVMTLEEVKQERICWIEDADDGMTVRLFPATMFGIGEYANGSKSYMFLAQKPWAIDANDCEWWYLIEDYGEIWRCWTSRPDDKRRAETPWESVK